MMAKMIQAQVRGDGTAGLQLRAETARSFHDRKKRKFLDELAGSANVTASAKAAGVASSTVYQHRRTDIAFRLAWDDAIDGAYDMLETMMLNRAIDYQRVLLEGDAERVREVPQISTADAMRLLKMHRDSVMQRRARIAALAAETSTDTREALRAKVIAISNRLLGKPDDAELEEDYEGECEMAGAG